jgi:hypothetical protein
MRTLLILATVRGPHRHRPRCGGKQSTTLSLVAIEQQCGGADLPPSDGSPGDVTMCRGRLPMAGTHARAGLAAWYCPYTGSERFGDLCTAVASLRGGDITLAGRLHPMSATSTWAVTGGTGAYATARGTADVKQLGDTKTAVTIRLR